MIKQLRRHSVLIFLLLFFIAAYSTLSIVRHDHYQSFGYDLGIDDQIVWQYSKFRLPITTIDDTPFTLSLTNHVELIYAVISPIYLVWNDVHALLVIQVLAMVFSAIPIYLLARKHRLNTVLCYVLVFTYLDFFGVQQALWFDVHSAVFGTSAVAWFIYFLDTNRIKLSWITFFLAIISKENYPAMTFLVALVYGIFLKRKEAFYFAGVSLLYLFLLFGIYFPNFVKGGYMYQAKSGLLSDINPVYLVNTADKRSVFFYSLLSFGFIPLVFPAYLIPYLGNLASYFVLGKDVSTAQGLFLHYRVELAPLVAFATILTIHRFKRLNTMYIALYIFVCALVVQYALHLPLSYLSKQWFWHEPSSASNINAVLKYIPPTASVASQNNITPHLSHRTDIFTLWPQKKEFTTTSICGKKECDWLAWGGEPQYVIVDTSTDWDIRDFLADRTNYLQSIANVEKAGFIKVYKKQGDAVLYVVLKNPSTAQ